jgi:hypothetical protein
MGDQLQVLVLGQRRADAADVGVGLPVGQAGEPVEPVTADAPPGLGFRLVEINPDRQVERVVTCAREVVSELLDPRLVRHGGMRERTRAPGLGRILASLAVNQVEALGLCVIGLKIGI